MKSIKCDLLFYQNFGTAQGQPLANLRKMAEDAGKSLAEYTPPEAETLEEMRMRAINFFNVISNSFSCLSQIW